MSGTASRIVLAASLVIAGISVTSGLLAHGNVTPQAVDTSKLPDIAPNNETFAKVNPYRADPAVYAVAQKIGESAYGQNCARCHGLEAISGGIAPDLRYLEVGEAGDEWYMERFQKGAVRDGKVYMPAMGEVLGQKAGWAIRSWLDTKHEE